MNITPEIELTRLQKRLDYHQTEFEVAFIRAVDVDQPSRAAGILAVGHSIRCDQIRHAMSSLRAIQIVRETQ